MRVKISRWLNHNLFGGRQDMMISSRVYVEDRQFLTALIDYLFWILRGEHNHCRNCFYYDFTGEDYAPKSRDSSEL